MAHIAKQGGHVLSINIGLHQKFRSLRMLALLGDASMAPSLRFIEE